MNIPSGQHYKVNNTNLAYGDVGAAASSHQHGGGDITSAVANATDADTVDGSHAAAFAAAAHAHAHADTTGLQGGAAGERYHLTEDEHTAAIGLTGDVTYYVNCDTGDDGNAGDADHPFETVEHALSIIPKNLNGYTAVIRLTASQNYDEVIEARGYIGGRLKFQNWGGVLWSGTAPLTITDCDDVWIYEIEFHATGNGSLISVDNSRVYTDACGFSEAEDINATAFCAAALANIVAVDSYDRDGEDPINYAFTVVHGSMVYYKGAFGANLQDTSQYDGALLESSFEIAQSNDASVTDNAIVRYHETDGRKIQDSLVTIDDSGSVNIPSGQAYKIDGSAHTHTTTDSVYLRAAEALSRGTNGAAYTAPIEASTNHEIYVALDFDKDTDEFAVWTLDLPTGWNAGTVTFLPKWTATGGSGTVCWSIRGVCIGDNVAIDTAFGTAVTSTDTLQNADRVHIGPETAAMTFAGTVAAGKWLAVEVSRDVSEDTLGQDARLLGLTMKFTRVV
jgi:hypothetical protein